MISSHPDGFSDDGLPADRDNIGQVKTSEKTVDILMQRVRRGDGVYIWKISNQTVAEIPHLYEYYGYGPFEETLSKMFPDAQFLGWRVVFVFSEDQTALDELEFFDWKRMYQKYE
jgi:MscS family membrane protein